MPVPRPVRPLAIGAAIAVAGSLAVPASAAPDGVPDILPVLAEPLDRGELVLAEAADVTPTPKVVDGDISDWVGTPSRIAAATHYDAGELLHTDFVFDAYGADGGDDVSRWDSGAFLFYEETRANRVDDLLRTSGSQLGVPEPIGADDEYGDATDLEVADLVDLRLAADTTDVHVLVRTTNLTDTDDLVVLLLADTIDGAGSAADPTLGLPDDHRYDVLLEVSTGQTPPVGVMVAGDASGWTNAVEIAVPSALLAPDDVMDLAVITGVRDDEGNLVPANIAFRHAEPVDIWNDRMQAFALHGDAPEGSHIDLFSSGPVDLADLRSGRTQTFRPGPGYHERQFDSGDKISFERGTDGRIQPYGLYVPEAFEPAVVTPLTFWLHYRGGKAHSGGAISPRLIREMAREPNTDPALHDDQQNLVVMPHGRGTSFWYVSRSHQDFFEVYDDAHGLFDNIDPTRRYLSGYSMGGYGTWLLGSLYPDLFAAGHSVSGAITQGAWTGVSDEDADEGACQVGDGETGLCYIEANSGDAAAQLTYRQLDNLRHVPMHVDHGTNDELVPVSGIQLQAARMVQLGYRVRMQTFAGYEHFTQAIVDEYADGAAYLQQFSAPEDPRQVTYRVVPALVRALNTVRLEDGQEPFEFQPDGAYWVDDIQVRDADPDDPTTSGLVDVTAGPLPGAPFVTVPEVPATVSPGHSTPFVRYGQQWVDDPLGTTPLANRFDTTLTSVASVRLDATRMGLVRDRDLAATLTTDGPSTVRLDGLAAGTGTLVCDCGLSTTVAWEEPQVDLSLTEAGVWTFRADALVVDEEEPTDPPVEGDPDPADPATDQEDAASEDPFSESSPPPPSSSEEPEDDPAEVARVAGDSRTATALAVSRTLADADTVVLARSDAYPDALTGTPLAVRLRAPMLLTDPSGLSDGILEEIERLGADDVVVLGGAAAVDEDVVDELRDAGLGVRRIAGADRFATAALVAAEFGDAPAAWVVEGANPSPDRGWPDAVSVAPVAGRAGQPILLTTRDTLPAATADALLARGVDRVTVAGGTDAVSAAVQDDLASLADVTRIAGEDRYATAIRVAATAPHTTGTTWLATGRDYPDALAAGPVVAMRGDRLLLVDGRDTIAARPVMAELPQGEDVRILGGRLAISTAVLRLVERQVR